MEGEFQHDVVKELEKRGFLIYSLKGESIDSLRSGGRKFFSTWHKDYPEFEQQKSPIERVAIDPSNLYFPESNRLSYNQQQELIENASREIGKDIPGIKIIRGGIPEWLEIAFQHQDATGERLFSNDIGYAYVNTSSTIRLNKENYDRHPAVGSFKPNRGIEIKVGTPATPESLGDLSHQASPYYAARLLLLPS